MMKLPSITCPVVSRSLFKAGDKNILSTCHPYAVANRSMFWWPTSRGPEKYARDVHEMNRQALEYRLKVGYGMFKDEFKYWFKQARTAFPRGADWPIYNDRELVKFWDFRVPGTSDAFIPTFDAVWEEGYSNASFTRSSTGCALFSGFLDTETMPADRSLTRVGWAAINSPHRRGPFFSDWRYDWSKFTHLCLRVRGDGRVYRITLACPEKVDVTYFRGFSYNLYTHGGPYWQELRIPFSRFYLQKLGALNDSQDEPELSRIQYLTISLTERVTGPFALEIDYIGLSHHSDHNEKCAYEGYAIKEAAREIQ